MRKLLSGVLLTGSLLVGGLYTQRAIVATATAVDQKDTELNVEVKEGKELSLVDPAEPSKLDKDSTNKLPPKDGSGSPIEGGINGPLALMYVTPALVFSPVPLDQTKDLAAQIDQTSSPLWKPKSDATGTDGKLVIEVGDLRGTMDGWKLDVTGTALKLDGPEKKTVKGAELHLPTGVALSSDQDGAAGGKSTIAANGATTDTTIVDSKTKKLTVALADDAANDGSTTILQAGKGSGYGVTTSQLDSKNIQLTLPVKQLQNGTYKSTITWTLKSV